MPGYGKFHRQATVRASTPCLSGHRYVGRRHPRPRQHQGTRRDSPVQARHLAVLKAQVVPERRAVLACDALVPLTLLRVNCRWYASVAKAVRSLRPKQGSVAHVMILWGRMSIGLVPRDGLRRISSSDVWLDRNTIEGCFSTVYDRFNFRIRSVKLDDATTR